MKKKLLLLLLITLFSCMGKVYASERYYLYECTNDAAFKKNREIKPHRIDHSANIDCKVGNDGNYSLVLDSYYKGTGKPWNALGGDESLNNQKNFKDHYPNFIVIDGLTDIDWYGFDDLSKARNHALDKLIVRGIFISETYRDMLRSSSPIIDDTVELTCTYGNKFSINFNPDGYPLSGSAPSGVRKQTSVQFSENFQNNKIDISNGCPEVYYCSYEKMISTGSGFGSKSITNYAIFRDVADRSISNLKCDSRFAINAHVIDNNDCPTYNDLFMELQATYMNGDIANYNKLKENIISTCSFIYEHADYGTTCVTMCLGLNDDLNALEQTVVEVNKCNLNDEIVAWIENILRWVKYIIPVIIIILSILDFIKALGSEKEDEMKKAQKRFATRLIVAVLIFIMPMIIEFILDKMGFDANNCNIKNIGF